VDLGTQVQSKMARARTKADKFVELTVSEELLKHYNCKGCHTWFSVGDTHKEPSFCPFCGKRIKEIECTK
jgi:rRNA maturation endonuclease Nob1